MVVALLAVVIFLLANSGGDKPYPQVIEKDVIKEIPVAPNASTYYDQGRGYYYDKNYDQAIAAYDKAIRLDPGNAKYFNSRAWVYALIGEYSKSLNNAEISLNLRPEIPNVLDTRAWAYVGLGKYDSAIEDFNDAIELRPESDFIDRRGVAYYRWGQYQAAIKDFSKAIELDPLFAMAHYDRSLAYAAIGNSASAEKDINQACLLLKQEAAHNEDYEDGRDLDCNHTVGGGWTALSHSSAR
jgi:tetratricopeptide (TPR) repeat protein